MMKILFQPFAVSTGKSVFNDGYGCLTLSFCLLYLLFFMDKFVVIFITYFFPTQFFRWKGQAQRVPRWVLPQCRNMELNLMNNNLVPTSSRWDNTTMICWIVWFKSTRKWGIPFSRNNKSSNWISSRQRLASKKKWWQLTPTIWITPT